MKDHEDKKEGIKAKRPGWIKIFPERWIFGSTREEMSNAERAVWIDFLSLAYLNDPPGQIDFTSFRRLAHQLNLSQKLLYSTIKAALANGKIKIIEYISDPNSGKKTSQIDLTFDQLDTKVISPGTSGSKIGISLYSIILLKWNEYQGEYLRQRQYRDREHDEKEAEDLTPKPVTQVTSRGEEGRKEEHNGEEGSPKIQSNHTSQSPLPSSPKDPGRGMTIKGEFLCMLKNCPGYRFDESKDSPLFDLVIKECPDINILKQLSKKILWWKDYPHALKANPREKLFVWFKEEQRLKERGGPQKIGDIINIEDPDHRNFMKQIITGAKKKEKIDEL